MDIYRISFIGHREIYCLDRIERLIMDIVTEKLEQKEYVEFYIGRNGDFDISAASAIKRVQRIRGHDNSSLILVQAYHTRDDVYYEKFYDEIQYPKDVGIHPKAAITKRNKWLVNNADLLIAYVEAGRK